MMLMVVLAAFLFYTIVAFSTLGVVVDVYYIMMIVYWALALSWGPVFFRHRYTRVAAALIVCQFIALVIMMAMTAWWDLDASPPEMSDRRWGSFALLIIPTFFTVFLFYINVRWIVVLNDIAKGAIKRN